MWPTYEDAQSVCSSGNNRLLKLFLTVKRARRTALQCAKGSRRKSAFSREVGEGGRDLEKLNIGVLEQVER